MFSAPRSQAGPIFPFPRHRPQESAAAITIGAAAPSVGPEWCGGTGVVALRPRQTRMEGPSAAAAPWFHERARGHLSVAVEHDELVSTETFMCIGARSSAVARQGKPGRGHISLPKFSTEEEFLPSSRRQAR